MFVILQVRQGFIYDEDQKAVSKSIRDRISQVMLNRRNAKREASGEEKKEKEKLDSDEQAIKAEGEDSDKEQPSAETEKEREDREEKDSSEGGDEPEAAVDVPVNIQGSGVKRVIDPTVQRLEGIAECSNSPHGTIDERTVPVSQDTASEKVSAKLVFIIFPFIVP